MYKNVKSFVQRLNFNPASPFCRRPRVRQLRRDIDALMASRRQRPLPLQRLRPLLQDERPKPSADQTETETGKRRQQNSLIGLVICFNSRIFHFLFSFFFHFPVIRSARGDYMCQLQDDNDDALATEPERGAGVQRLRTLLQTPQRK